MTDETTETKQKKRTISPELWDKVEKAWANGKFATLADISEHFSIPEKSLKARFDNRGIRRGSAIEDYNRKVQEELDRKAAEEAKIVADRIAETREEHYKMATAISKLTFKELMDARNNGVPIAGIIGNLKSLETAMKVLKIGREERFAVLGLNDQGEGDSESEEAPMLLVSELSAEQIEQMRNRQPVDDIDDESVIGDDIVMGLDDDEEEEGDEAA